MIVVGFFCLLFFKFLLKTALTTKCFYFFMHFSLDTVCNFEKISQFKLAKFKVKPSPPITMIRKQVCNREGVRSEEAKMFFFFCGYQNSIFTKKSHFLQQKDLLHGLSVMLHHRITSF